MQKLSKKTRQSQHLILEVSLMHEIALTLDRQSNRRSGRKIVLRKSPILSAGRIEFWMTKQLPLEFKGKDADGVRQYLRDLAEGSEEIIQSETIACWR